MGAVSNLVSVQEYLQTVYRPDCDYVDGALVERNVGEIRHARAQRAVLLYMHEKRKRWNIFALQETRVHVSPTGYRVPDVCVGLGPEPEDGILTEPPFLCVEILSPEDRISRMQERYTAETIQEVRDGILRTADPELNVPLAEVVR